MEKELHVIRDHQGNVFNLLSSPVDRYPARYSVDNKMEIEWGETTRVASKRITGYTNLDKGLCWDPLGMFLTSQREKAMVVWRTLDWGDETD